MSHVDVGNSSADSTSLFHVFEPDNKCTINNITIRNMSSMGLPGAQAVDIRVLDYLDDKLQSLADFDTLDNLLDSVKAQQDLLKQQVWSIPVT